MATRKKSTRKKSTTKRKVGAVRTRTIHASPRRRATRKKVSGIGAISENMEVIIGAVGGAFAARIIQKNIPAPTSSTSTDYRPYAGLVLGVAAVMFGKKSKVIEAMGVGAIVEGSRALITDQMIPSLLSTAPAKTVVSGKRLPFTAGHNQVRVLNGKNKKRMMGNQQRAILAGSPSSLASVYDGM